MNLIFFKLIKAQKHEFDFFTSFKKRSKHMDLIVCKQPQRAKKIDLIFCKLQNTQKI